MANNDRLFSTTRKKRKLKDKKIQFYAMTNKVDDYGTPIGQELGLIHNNIWAYARQTSAAESYQGMAHGYEYEVDMLFTINYREGLNNDMLIRYKDDVYVITRIDYFEGYKEDIVISGTNYTKYHGKEFDEELKPF